MKLHNATDRIEKEIVLRAPRSRVWRALADAEEFGAWFGMKLEGRFAPGARAHGQIALPGHGNVTIEIAIERMDPREPDVVPLASIRRRIRRGLLERAHHIGRVPTRGSRGRNPADRGRVRLRSQPGG